MPESLRKYYRIDRREIWYFHSIFEAYDGLATVTTMDPKPGVVRVLVAPGSEGDVDSIIGSLKKDGIRIEAYDWKIVEAL